MPDNPQKLALCGLQIKATFFKFLTSFTYFIFLGRKTCNK